MSSFGLIEENIELSHIHLAVLPKISSSDYLYCLTNLRYENFKTQMLHTLNVFCQNLNSQLSIYGLTITVSNFDLILMSLSAKNQSLFYIFVLWFRSICIKIK